MWLLNAATRYIEEKARSLINNMNISVKRQADPHLKSRLALIDLPLKKKISPQLLMLDMLSDYMNNI